MSGQCVARVARGDRQVVSGGRARAVLNALLEKYRDEGVLNLDDANVLRVTPFTAMGSVVQLINAFGGKEGFEKAVRGPFERLQWTAVRGRGEGTGFGASADIRPGRLSQSLALRAAWPTPSMPPEVGSTPTPCKPQCW